MHVEKKCLYRFFFLLHKPYIRKLFYYFFFQFFFTFISLVHQRRFFSGKGPPYWLFQNYIQNFSRFFFWKCPTSQIHKGDPYLILKKQLKTRSEKTNRATLTWKKPTLHSGWIIIWRVSLRKIVQIAEENWS